MQDSPENPPEDDDFDPDEGWKNEDETQSFNLPVDKPRPKKQPKSKFLDELSKVAVKVGSTVGKVAIKVGDTVGKAAIKVGDTVGTLGKYVGSKIEDSFEDLNDQIKEKKRFDNEVKKYQAEMHAGQDTQIKKGIDQDIWQDAIVAPKAPLVSLPKPAVISTNIHVIKENVSIFDHFTLEMRDLYQNAQEFMELGQDTQAMHCYELLLHQAEELENQIIIDFVQKEMNNLFK